MDEIPFDFQRRIMSVVVRTPEGKDRIISKGAPEAIFPRCKNFELDGELLPDGPPPHRGAQGGVRTALSADGFRVLAIASKDIAPRGVVAGDATPYSKADECDLILNGYVAFLDPPKETATAAIKALQGHGVSVKVVTGDNDLVARKICKEVGLSTEFVLLGSEVEKMSDEQLADAAERTTLFARVSPAHKQRIIKALQSRQHTVGFMGDGINDAPALRAADVGISVDTAVDIAKESADMILLEKSLLVLEEGVIEGRKVFANILKYVRMGASSNFGNMFSVLGASVFVPFLPMAPIQILANNLLYDISQTAIPTDDVDPEQVEKPRPWDMKQLTRFIVFIGPCSSIFDYTTYFMMLYVFNCWNISHARGRGPQREPVSDRLVRGEPAHADAHHPHHPHQQDPVPAEPPVVAADGDVRGHHGDRHRHPVHAAGTLPRLHGAAAAVLAAAGAHAAVLRRPDAGGQDVAAAAGSGSEPGSPPSRRDRHRPEGVCVETFAGMISA